jgi:hypothetical protein
MPNRFFRFGLATTLGLVIGVAGSATAQISASTRYERGQSVQPVYEGWEQNADGTYSMWFGYLNRNWNQRITVPVGSENSFQPGNADRGQPTIFETADNRRQEFAFKVVLPADWPKDRDLVWTLTANSVTLTAIGSLWPVWLVSDDVIATNRGGQRIYDPKSTNKRPVLTEAAKGGTVPVGTPLTLTMGVTDDGQPRRRAPGELVPGGAGRGPAPTAMPSLREALKVSWLQWRGPGMAQFNPAEVRVLEADGTYSGTGGKATTTVTFDTPGTYVLRAYIQDMSLMTIPPDISVVVEKR